jgi:aryl-alcohol dehydrogenase-like predicted oxidoreductase
VERASLVIATRIALTRPVIGGLTTYIELIRRCAEDSIRRIGCDYLDFLVVEWTDAIAPVAESMAAFAAVIASGEVRQVVPANFPLGRMIEALAASHRASHPIAGVQFDYSLATRSTFEGSMAKLGADHDLGVVARSPLAGGHLARRGLASGVGALRHRGARDRHAAISAEGIWPALSAVAREHHRSPAQVALAWALAHPAIDSVLVSVTSAAQLQELFGATHLQLTDADSERLGRTPSRAAHAAFASSNP